MTMKEKIKLLLIMIIGINMPNYSYAQLKDYFDLSGQVIFKTYVPLADSDPKIAASLNYIPQFNYQQDFTTALGLSLEASADIYGQLYVNENNHFKTKGSIDPYRLWAGIALDRLEVKLGLQQINFGTAQIFRPLQWFDQIDYHEPTKKTKGVWAGLIRYSLQDNTNIWLWGLTEQKNIKVQELFNNENDHNQNKQKYSPEFGGRIQFPITSASDWAFSYHHRSKINVPTTLDTMETAEHKLGFDAHLDYIIGMWTELSVSKYTKDLGDDTWNKQITFGADYSISTINNSLLYLMAEHFISANSHKIEQTNNVNSISSLTLSYPFTSVWSGKISNLYHWKFKKTSTYFNLEGKWDKTQLDLMVNLHPNKQKDSIKQSTMAPKIPNSNVMLTLTWFY